MEMISRGAMSPWSSGFKNNAVTFRPAAFQPRLGAVRMVRMGQSDAPLSQAQRDSLLSDLNAAWTKAASIDSWRSSHPNWQGDLGTDVDSYINMSNNASIFVNTAARVRQILQSTDPASWVIPTQDLNDAGTWSTFIGGIFDLIKKHTSVMPPAPVTQTPPSGGVQTPAPVAKTDYTVPIIGAAAAIALAVIIA